MEEVVEVDPAVNRGPHHAPQVCSLEVGAHYFIKFAVTQHLKKYMYNNTMYTKYKKVKFNRNELSLLKCQINTNAKKRIFASYKMFRKGIEILILSFKYFKLSIS